MMKSKFGFSKLVIGIVMLGLITLLSACGGGGGAATASAASPWVGAKQLGAVGFITVGYSDVVDANGNVYVAGYTTGGLDGNTLTGTNDFFVTKYNSSGIKQYRSGLAISDSPLSVSLAQPKP